MPSNPSSTVGRGQKRPSNPNASKSVPNTPTVKAGNAAAKKQKTGNATAVKSKPLTNAFSEDDSDDDAAIFALKAKASAGSVARASAADEDEEFEVAETTGDDMEDVDMKPNAPPSEEDDDADNDDDNDSDDDGDVPASRAVPTKSAPVTPTSKTAPTNTTNTSTPAKPATTKQTPAKPATSAPLASAAAKTQTPVAAVKKPIISSADDSETSESESDDEKAPAPSKPAAKLGASKPTPVASKPTAPLRSTLGDSSESSDDEDPSAISAAAASLYRKKTEKKPTPLHGDASVNPPPKAKKPTPPAASSSTPTSSFEKPLTRPPTAPHTGRKFTVSIALPGSIISNAQSKELRTYVAGQIARAAATFNVDEVVIFAEGAKQGHGGVAGNFEGATRSTDPDIFLTRILQYLETPQYLRKALFPKHADLALAGLLNPLDSPHHVRIDEDVPYREGVVVKRPVSKTKEDAGCWANIGLKTEAFIDRQIEVGTRVTVHIPQVAGSTTRKQVSGRAVAPSTPREKNGTYWGYTTRLAQSLSQVWSECPFKGGYDLSVGTSEHGVDCHAHDFTLPQFNHMIIFFGGLAGLEEHIGADETINVKSPDELFQLYVNSVIGQGCRTIRTEEAIPITLSALYRHIRTNIPPAGAV